MRRIFTFLLMISFWACVPDKSGKESAEEKGELKFRVEDAPEWTALFKRDSGWFGGDGIFAIPLDGKEILKDGDTTRNLFVFSDTMHGLIEDGELQEGFVMVNNSIAVLKGHDPDPKKMEFKVLKDENGDPATLFIPKTPETGKDDYFWLGDGFVNPADKATYLFAYRIVNIPDQKVFGFEEVGNVLIKIPAGSEYPFKDIEQFDIPFHSEGPEASMGAGVFVNTAEANAPDPDGFIYVYGVRGENKELVAARTTPEKIAQFEEWVFWDGEGWTSDPGKAAGLGTGVSNELSVSPLTNGKYALVFQKGIFANTVAMRIGDSPAGPFTDEYDLWDTSTALDCKECFAYNAKAHPSLSRSGELLISFNVNSFDFFNDVLVHPNLYRPRFFKVIFE